MISSGVFQSYSSVEQLILLNAPLYDGSNSFICNTFASQPQVLLEKTFLLFLLVASWSDPNTMNEAELTVMISYCCRS